MTIDEVRTFRRIADCDPGIDGGRVFPGADRPTCVAVLGDEEIVDWRPVKWERSDIIR